MADLKDEFGNPVQLTDEFGNPVTLTDEHGNPMHVVGLATTRPIEASVVTVEDVLKSEVTEERKNEVEPLQRSGSSSSTSSSGSDAGEVEGQGETKKKGLKQKIKEKLTGGKHHKDDKKRAEQGHLEACCAGGVQTHDGEAQFHEHEKKGVMEKIKDILPGHHGH